MWIDRIHREVIHRVSAAMLNYCRQDKNQDSLCLLPIQRLQLMFDTKALRGQLESQFTVNNERATCCGSRRR